MSDTIEDTPETPEVDATDVATEEAPQTDPNKSLAEAKDRYRGERDAARVELGALAQRVERMQRAEVERLAADSGLSLGSDVFTMSGNGVADYLTEDGEVDPEKVAADVAAVLAERPGLRKQSPAIDPSLGLGGKTPAKREPSWGALLKH